MPQLLAWNNGTTGAVDSKQYRLDTVVIPILCQEIRDLLGIGNDPFNSNEGDLIPAAIEMGAKPNAGHPKHKNKKEGRENQEVKTTSQECFSFHYALDPLLMMPMFLHKYFFDPVYKPTAIAVGGLTFLLIYVTQ